MVFSTLLGHLVIALWPQSPLAVTRIWCLYELWCAIELKIPITAGFTDENKRKLIFELITSGFELFQSEKKLLAVDVEKAQATKVEDIQLILSKIKEYPGVAELNKQVSEDFSRSVRKYAFRATTRLGVACSVAVFFLISFGVSSAKRVTSVLFLTVIGVGILIMAFFTVNLLVPRLYTINISSCQFYSLLTIFATLVLVQVLSQVNLID
jgi:hypothetical protein